MAGQSYRHCCCDTSNTLLPGGGDGTGPDPIQVLYLDNRGTCEPAYPFGSKYGMYSSYSLPPMYSGGDTPRHTGGQGPDGEIYNKWWKSRIPVPRQIRVTYPEYIQKEWSYDWDGTPYPFWDSEDNQMPTPDNGYIYQGINANELVPRQVPMDIVRISPDVLYPDHGYIGIEYGPNCWEDIYTPNPDYPTSASNEGVSQPTLQLPTDIFYPVDQSVANIAKMTCFSVDYGIRVQCPRRGDFPGASYGWRTLARVYWGVPIRGDITYTPPCQWDNESCWYPGGTGETLHIGILLVLWLTVRSAPWSSSGQQIVLPYSRWIPYHQISCADYGGVPDMQMTNSWLRKWQAAPGTYAAEDDRLCPSVPAGGHFPPPGRQWAGTFTWEYLRNQDVAAWDARTGGSGGSVPPQCDYGGNPIPWDSGGLWPTVPDPVNRVMYRIKGWEVDIPEFAMVAGPRLDVPVLSQSYPPENWQFDPGPPYYCPAPIQEGRPGTPPRPPVPISMGSHDAWCDPYF